MGTGGKKLHYVTFFKLISKKVLKEIVWTQTFFPGCPILDPDLAKQRPEKVFLPCMAVRELWHRRLSGLQLGIGRFVA